ncbi:MAG: T9SS type A sorting domain-containing protein [Bacteroidetes bacterium]|nr:T9SS type A sorting domain-containing protein [Bacteroidota bacterium]
MKRFFTCVQVVIALCLMQLFIIPFAVGQPAKLTARPNTYVSEICNGYYEYLPANYDPNKKYPLIITFHGVGENGDGSPSVLANLTNTGLVALLKSGNFPTSFSVNGTTYQFIIIAPQFTTNPQANCDGVYQYAISHYPVDINRVYLTGYSQGGGNCFEYTGPQLSFCQKIAAMVPICPTTTVQSPWAQHMASANLPILATHNQGDQVWSYTSTIDNINFINSQTPPPVPRARDTIFAGGDHDAWDHTVNPSLFTYNGLNIYEWMLQYSRNLTSALPVVLSSYTAAASGPSSVTVNWTTSSEINNDHFVVEHSTDGISFMAIATIQSGNHPNGSSYSSVDANAAAGNNYYRLVQVDIDGKTTYFDILKITLSGSATTALRLSPNPVLSMTTLQLSHPETGFVQVILSDMQGRVLRSWRYSKPGIYWQQTLDLSGVPAGTYTLQVNGNTIRETQQFVKQ